MRLGQGRGHWILAAALLLVTLSCPMPPRRVDMHAVDASTSSRHEPKTPLSPKELRTTDGTLAAGNFQGQIRELERQLAAHPTDADRSLALVQLLGARAQFFGRLEDYDRALKLAESVVAARPKAADSYLVRAGARAALHQFADAYLDVEQANRLGAPRARVDEIRASLALASGQLDLALALAKSRVQHRADATSLGSLAVVFAAMGSTAEASAAFLEAQGLLVDPSPFPLAWLYFQEGLVAERAGHWARARELYEAAHERLPAYASVAGHLAGVLASTGEKSRAITLLRSITSDDPEYPAQLALLLVGVDDEEAATLREWARSRFEELVLWHPAAFADHAARFYLAAGADPRRALKLAEINRGLRATGDSLELLIEAALAAHAPSRACSVADEARSVTYPSPALLVAMSRAFTACDRHGDASEIARRVRP